MKKNISINLQGIIFHIEEDGYDILGRYLAEVKAHFASYRGHEDIVADIEGRIAEIFAARLSPTQQVIALEDVEAMMAKMGRVSDFAAETDEDDEATAGAASATAYASAGNPGSHATAPTAAAEAGPRRLYRDMANRKIGGVAAGLAQYFLVNPLWVRLGFLALFFLKPLLMLVSFGLLHLDNNGGSAGLAILTYVILWIALPKRYDAPPLEDNLNLKSLNGRKYFRDTDNGKIGGVAAGLAPYLNLDVTLIRVLLLAGLFAGGFTFLLYIILWIAAPQAKTVADRMRMRGDDMTLEGFDSNMRNNAFDGENAPAGNRPVGTFLEDLGRGLRPLVNFIGSSIRIVAGLILTVAGFALVLMLAIIMGVALGLIPSSENIMAGDVPAHVLLNGVPVWGILAGFFAFGIPALAMLLAGLNLLLRRSLMNRMVSLSLLGLWLLSVVGVTMAGVRQSREFQYDADVEQLSQYPALTAPVLLLDARDIDREYDQQVSVRLAGLDSGRTVEVLRTLSAKGPSEEEARRTAGTSIDYTIQTKGDSSLLIDDHFSFQPNARFRKQEVDLTLRLPRDRTFRLSRNFAYLIDQDSYANGRRPNEPTQHRYRLAGNKLECIGCTDDQLEKDYSQEDNDEDDEGINIRIDGDDEDGDDSKTSINFGSVPSFNTNLDYYGSGRRTFAEQDFNEVHVKGNYRVLIRQGETYKVEAGGDDSALKDLRVEHNGNTLDIRSRRTGLFGGSWNDDDKKVLVSITMPSLTDVDMAGAVRGDISGFKQAGRLKVQQAGASHLRLNGEYGQLALELAGACRTNVVGTADELKLEGAGACELAAADLKVRRADIDLAGVSKARLQVTETLKADAVGACVIEYSGNPQNVDADATGASRVKRLKD
jgi:phage shock protein PspC (stress-responsive transcriptional regulator)